MKSKLAEKIKQLATICENDEEFLFTKLEQIIEKKKSFILKPTETHDISSIFEDFLTTEKNNKFDFIKTGWENVDESMFGFVPGEFIVIGGRPGMGKSVVLIDLIRRLSENIPCLFLSLDLSKYQVTNRIISSFLDTDFQILNPSDLRNIGEKRLSSANLYTQSLQLSINESSVDSMFMLRAYLEKIIQEKGIRVIAIDYLQLLSVYRYRHYRELEISYICSCLKKIAKDFNVCVIVTSQLSRSVETRGGDKRPQLADLRESGAIEQDADKVFFVYRPSYYGLTMDENGISTEGLLTLILAKNRIGKIEEFNFQLTFPSLKLEPQLKWSEQFNFRRKNLFDEDRDNIETETPF
ncbi:MAG: hypothetical protein FGM14_16740 [Flavobacteriales bacterium]|nr:hypothetical protein [Flavobacteriales bacterium]